MGWLLRWHLRPPEGEAPRLAREPRLWHGVHYAMVTHGLDAGAALVWGPVWWGPATIQYPMREARHAPAPREAQVRTMGMRRGGVGDVAS